MALFWWLILLARNSKEAVYLCLCFLVIALKDTCCFPDSTPSVFCLLFALASLFSLFDASERGCLAPWMRKGLKFHVSRVAEQISHDAVGVGEFTNYWLSHCKRQSKRMTHILRDPNPFEEPYFLQNTAQPRDFTDLLLS